MRDQREPALRVLVFSILIYVTCAHSEPLRIVASTTDLAAIAEEIGGEHTTIESLSQPNQDPHSFEILPWHVIAMRQADLYLRVGAGLDYWSDELLNAAGNSQLKIVDCSLGITLIRDEDEEDHGHGEHEAGNPHYWLGPSNIPLIAVNIVDGLRQIDPEHSAEYTQALSGFVTRFSTALAGWKASMLICQDARIVTYHRSWGYFARDFGMQIIGTVEPRPGAEPSPASLALLERAIRREQAQLLFLEPFESDRLARLLARDTGIEIVPVPPSVGGAAAAQDIFSFFDFLTREVQAHCAASHP